MPWSMSYVGLLILSGGPRTPGWKEGGRESTQPVVGYGHSGAAYVEEKLGQNGQEAMVLKKVKGDSFGKRNSIDSMENHPIRPRCMMQAG